MRPENAPLASAVLLDGTEAVPAEQVRLQAGPVSLLFDHGSLRSIRLGDDELLQQVYVAVRDQHWGTVAARLSNIDIQARPRSFVVSYDAEHVQPPIDFRWHATVTGAADGTIEFKMDGEARRGFLRNRIGFCILHPCSAAGAHCRIEHVDGSVEHATLPQQLVAEQPVAPFADMRALRHQVRPGVHVELRMSGDVFEMEDQRNWTDASYKTFCTPLRLPYPVFVPQGSRLRQSVKLSLQQAGSGAVESRKRDRLRFTWSGAGRPIPALGLGMAGDGQALDRLAIERLLALKLGHLRVDLPLGGDDTARRLQQAAVQAHTLGVRLDVGLLLPGEPDRLLAQLAAELELTSLPVATWLVYPAAEALDSRPPLVELITAARAHLSAAAPGAAFAAGTNSDFIFFNRYPPPPELLDRATFAINPQVHAFDDISVMETLQVQAMVVDNARRLAGDVPVMVSPVTLKPRFNPYAGGPAAPRAAGTLPPTVDRRQMSLFGAAWTAGSLAALLPSGAQSLTYYETAGWHGVLEQQAGSPLPELFRSLPGSVFPLYHVLADVGDFRDGEVLAGTSSNARLLAGFALRRIDRVRLVLANLSREPLQVLVDNAGGAARVRTLDLSSAEHAIREPEAFRAGGVPARSDASGGLELELLPYAVATIDVDDRRKPA